MEEMDNQYQLSRFVKRRKTQRGTPTCLRSHSTVAVPLRHKPRSSNSSFLAVSEQRGQSPLRRGQGELWLRWPTHTMLTAKPVFTLHICLLYSVHPHFEIRPLRPREGTCPPTVPEPINGLQSCESFCDCRPRVVPRLCLWKDPRCARSGTAPPARAGAVSKLQQASLSP